jgi:hypothetical protein
MTNKEKQLEAVARAFGHLRAEYAAEEDVFAMFSRPVYWAQLVSTRPSFLIGGRGTGKTTALKGLSFAGQAALNGNNIEEWASIGAYLRVETNVVSAFKGRRQTDEDWERIFSHFVNLQLTERVLSFVEWLEKTRGKAVALPADELELCCYSLGIPAMTDIADMGRFVRRRSVQLEYALNNPKHLEEMETSVLGAPIKHITQALAKILPAGSPPFSFAIDEYENLRPSQQRIFNTLVKHVGDAPYTFKIGVRDGFGWSRDTLAPEQTLSEPADFAAIRIVDHIKEQNFAKFARSICNQRLTRALGANETEIQVLFPGLTILEEAHALELDKALDRIRTRLLRGGATDAQLKSWTEMLPLEAAMVGFWADSKGIAPLDALSEALGHPQAWTTRTGNYAYAMLFTLRRRVRGIRKYYAGWQTYSLLADGNIRYMLQLVHEALSTHIASGKSLNDAVSIDNQTIAASRVGQKILGELDGTSANGAALTKLALGLGRIFQVLASEPFGHTPEVNQFRVNRSSNVLDDRALSSLLRDATSQNLLLAFPADKRASVSAETLENDYQMHPIFAPYFVYGHRRKRRMTISGREVLALSNDRTGQAVKQVLYSANGTVPDTLPTQLALYEELLLDDH